MKRRLLQINLLPVLCLVLLAGGVGAGQEKNEITTEWIFGGPAFETMTVPSFAWLEDGTAVIYDYRTPPKELTFERLNPNSGEHAPMLDMRKAVSSLNTFLGKQNTPDPLPWPNAFDSSGRLAVFIFKDDIYILNLASAQFQQVTRTQSVEKCVSFSPNGEQLAFVRDNDLYTYDIRENVEKRLTQDGAETVLNGTLSWVYLEEIFGRHDTGYWWSKDSKAIAYLKTEQSQVSQTYYTNFKDYQPYLLKQRYPRAGQANPIVGVYVVEVADVRTTCAHFDDKYEYITRVGWLPKSDTLSVQTMNRAQNELSLYFVDRSTGKARSILKETDDAWVNIYDTPYFTGDGKYFIWTSERSGYAHLYRYTTDGKLVNQITKGEWPVRPSGAFAIYEGNALKAVDEQEGWVYFTAGEKSSIEKHLYRIKLDGSNMQRLSQEDGSHDTSFSPDSHHYFDNYSNISTLPSLSLRKSDGKLVKVIAAPLTELISRFNIQYPEPMKIPAADGFLMPAQLLKPRDLDPNKKYPVIIYVYGGPSAPVVSNAWNFLTYFDQILLRNGYLVMYIDNRSSTSISKTLEKTIKDQMIGNIELNDLLSAVRWLKARTYVDPTRIGIWGWSAGGTYTLLAMTHSKEFKAGIAISAVTDWRYYDSRWAEFAMRRPEDNLEGYENTSVVKAAKNLNGRLLLVHGTNDNNVHIQNTWAFSDQLIRAGKMFDMMIYPMRRHGIDDPPARIHLFNTMLDFWKKNL